MENNKCAHRKIKKHYPFGRKSTARKKCMICGKIISNKLLKEMAIERKKKRR